MKCPSCGEQCQREDVDVGVGIIYGPWGCECGWSESEKYNLLNKKDNYNENGYQIDQYGGLYPHIRKER